MQVTDNFLPTKAFEDLQEYCNQNEFEIIKAGEKEFSVLKTPNSLLDFFKIEGYELVLTFLRRANKDIDTDLRIHADNVIVGRKTALASVLYINNKDEATPNGTVFWEHHIHGQELAKNVSNKEFDRLITEDSNDIQKWEVQDLIKSRPNRQLLYNSNLFHSKWPPVIETGERRVLVCFYAEKTKV